MAATVPARHRTAHVRQIGPLTWSGAAELTASLPAVRLLDDAERDRAWRLTAGHPLAIEYLDSLLAAGEPFSDVADRIEAMIQARTGEPLPRTEPTELAEATAEMIAAAAGEQMFGALFDGLSPGTRDLLVRASVFRVPIPAAVLAGRPGQIAECETAGLLAAGPGSELSVHRHAKFKTNPSERAVVPHSGHVVADHRGAAPRCRRPAPRRGLDSGTHAYQDRTGDRWSYRVSDLGPF